MRRFTPRWNQQRKGSRNELLRPTRAGLALWLCSHVARRWLSRQGNAIPLMNKNDFTEHQCQTKPLHGQDGSRQKQDLSGIMSEHGQNVNVFQATKMIPHPGSYKLSYCFTNHSCSHSSLRPATQDLLRCSIMELHPLLDGIQSRAKPYFLEPSPKSPNTRQILNKSLLTSSETPHNSPWLINPTLLNYNNVLVVSGWIALTEMGAYTRLVAAGMEQRQTFPGKNEKN